MRAKITVVIGSLAAVCCISAFAEKNSIDYAMYLPQAKKIVSGMTLQEKIGQMTLTSIDFLYQDGGLQLVTDAKLGGVLAEGNTVPNNGPSLENWQSLMKEVRAHQVILANGSAIPLLLGTDAVHGDQHVANAVVFPHNIGLGATHDPKLIQEIAGWTAYDIKKSGFNWVYAPTVAVAHDYRWGRTYESFSSDPAWVERFAAAYVRGAQAIENQKLQGVLTSTKHFMGDGNTEFGRDEGNVVVTDFDQFYQENYPGYRGAFSESTGNVMISYSSINDVPMSVNQTYLQQNLFPHFNGFVVSDYAAAEKAAMQLKKPFNVVLADVVNSGMDMLMISQDFPWFYTSIAEFQQILLNDVNNGWIESSRIDEAVTRILQVKLALGLFDEKQLSMPQPLGNENQVALQAAEESLVLLKNNLIEHGTALPIDAKKIKNVILLGDQGYTYTRDGKAEPNGIYKFDDIGSQCGGWRILWQGQEGNQYTDEKASSVLTGIQAVLGKQTVYLTNPDDLKTWLTQKNNTSKNTVAIAVIAEFPYAEFMGDVGNDNSYYQPRISSYVPAKQLRDLIINYDDATRQRIKLLKEKGIPVITILISGRPMIINASPDAPFNLSDALIAAWLPGTTGGQAIANAIFGHYHFGKKEQANVLSFAWPRSMDQIDKLACINNGKSSRTIPLFNCGEGLRD